jgi:hypothetical protein
VGLRGLEPLTSSMPSTVGLCGGPALIGKQFGNQRRRQTIDRLGHTRGQPGFDYLVTPTVDTHHHRVGAQDHGHRPAVATSRAEQALSCVDAPVYLDKLILKHPDVHRFTLDGSDSGAEQPIELVNSPIPYIAPEARKVRHPHHMLLTFEELGGHPTIARWLEIAPQFQRALNSLMSVKYAEQMFCRESPHERHLWRRGVSSAYPERAVHGTNPVPTSVWMPTWQSRPMRITTGYSGKWDSETIHNS